MLQTFQSQEVDGSLVFDEEQPKEELEEEATLGTECVDENDLNLYNLILFSLKHLEIIIPKFQIDKSLCSLTIPWLITSPVNSKSSSKYLCIL